MRATMIALALVALCGAMSVQAVVVGDENFSVNTVGRFYVFANKTIQIIEPSNITLDFNITTDQDGNDLVNANNEARTWNDAVYLQKDSSRYVLVNEGDTYTSSNGSAYAYTTVIDANNHTIAGRVQVGARAVHIYAVTNTSKAWVHSDAEGNFYVLDVTSNSPFTVTSKIVPAFTTKAGHGKLVMHNELYPIAYATNVNENRIYKLNLETESNMDNITFTQTNCTSLHSGVYSRVNQHIFFECTSDGGIIEYDTKTNTTVGAYDTLGVLSVTPLGDMVFATQSLNSTVTMIVPGANGQRSSVYKVVAVPSQPDAPIFFSNATTPDPLSYQDYLVFFPTARNTQKWLVRSTDDAVTQPGYYVKPTDCSYASGSSPLTLATASNGSVETPLCGACAASIPPQAVNSSDYYHTLAGFSILDLNETHISNSSVISVPAGAVLPARNLATNANQCSFTTPSRSGKRGGDYVATVADLPSPRVYIVPGKNPSNSVGFIETANNPKKLVWAPAAN